MRHHLRHTRHIASGSRDPGVSFPFMTELPRRWTARGIAHAAGRAALPALLVPALLAAAGTASTRDDVAPAVSGTDAPGTAAGAAARGNGVPAPGTVLDSGAARSVQPLPSSSEGTGEGDGSGAGSVDAGSSVEASAPLDVRPFTFASRDVHDRPMEVSAALVTSPDGWTGQGPRPLLVVAPGTSGMADRCAPSRKAAEGQMTDAAVREFADAGWAVVLTDYQGLGTPGTHTYMVRAAQGHAVLDAARAGLALDDAAVPGSPVAITGYSQGGGAAAAAAELAPSYAPELDLRGVVAGAVPADLAEVAETIDGSVLAGATGYTINGLVAAYPELEPQLDRLMNDRGRAMLETVNDQCAAETMLMFNGRTTDAYSVDGRSLTEHLHDNADIRARVDEQRIGRLTPRAPLFMMHNVADDIVPFAQGRHLAEEWCSAGADVRFTTVDEDLGPLMNHGIAQRKTQRAQWEFLRSAVLGDGPSTPSNCGAF